ncbi:hypothetical protein HMPREF0577_1302 [Mobiluncus mulieris ATCC 35243]|nr:hypothetical protein HMPREF0577_1302 [Mobiluncus mulieris ATCC 35243]
MFPPERTRNLAPNVHTSHQQMLKPHIPPGQTIIPTTLATPDGTS